MIRTLVYNIECGNITIKDFLKSKRFRSKIISQIKRTDNGITVNGEYKFVNYILNTNDILKIIVLDETPSDNILPMPIEIDIIYEDEDIAVINKPAGMPVHPTQGHFCDTLANGVMNYYGKDFVFRCVNRLDRDTSGLLIIAKNKLSSGILSEMVAKNEISREYLAIVSGDIPYDNGEICAPIARAYDSTIERVVDFDRGDFAKTNFEKLSFKNSHSLIKIKLETGKTHQIRVHMKHLGYPLIGDFLYNPDFDNMNRQALHSHKLAFNHPVTGEFLEFVQELPQDMQFIYKN